MGRPRVVVIGAGVVGLCTALNIQEHIPGCELTVIADKFEKDTTSDGAAGIFRPVADHIPGTDVNSIRKWSKDSWDLYSKLAASEEADAAGVTIVSGYHVLFKSEEKEQVFKDIIFACRPCTEGELNQYEGISSKKHAYAFTTVIVECRWFLPWLTKRIKAKGGFFIRRHINNLQEVMDDFDVVINCAGLENRTMTQDSFVVPVRGQVMRVRAPWIKHAFWTDQGCFVFPCKENVVVGGTKQYRDENLSPTSEDRDAIWKSACLHIPSLKAAVFERDWVGLRPLRSPIRVEAEQKLFRGNPKQIFHNYGHGSYGVALGWGTGKEIAQTLTKQMKSSNLFLEKSKL